MWIITGIILALISTAICGFISPAAQGSGIPELKTILSGVAFFQQLLPKTLLAKALGLIAIQAAGFNVGFEGPIIHCSSIIAEMVMSMEYFSEFRKVKTI